MTAVEFAVESGDVNFISNHALKQLEGYNPHPRCKLVTNLRIISNNLVEHPKRPVPRLLRHRHHDPRVVSSVAG